MKPENFKCIVNSFYFYFSKSEDFPFPIRRGEHEFCTCQPRLTNLHNFEKWKIGRDHQRCFLLYQDGNNSKRIKN